MYKRIKWFLLLFGTFSLSACFEVVEELNVNKDGSGQMTVTLNLSQSKTKIASVMLLDSINGYKVPDKQHIQQEVNELVAMLGKIPGISAVKQQTNFDNFIVTISFSFSEVNNLNSINKVIYERLKVKPAGQSAYTYNTTKQLFSRNYRYSPKVREAYVKLKEEDRPVFKNATYTSIYRFEHTVGVISNKSAKLSANKRAIMLRSDVLDLINGAADITNHIQLAN